MKLLKFYKGFTMIELLIVIAVLGILAVAVLSAINPIEQINRGKDTGSRSDAEQLISASDRYYAGKGYYPWMTTVNSDNTWTDPTALAEGSNVLLELDGIAVAVGVDGEEMLNVLSTGGASELKSSFTSRISDTTNSNALWIYNSGTSGESTYVCFVPKSASFREEAWRRCASAVDTLNPTLPTDFPTSACPVGATCLGAATADAATACYICLP